MGITYADLKLTNLLTSQSVSIRALVDTGADKLIVTAAVAQALGFDPEDVAVTYVTVADGRRVRAPRIRPVHIEFEDRDCTMDAWVLGDQCLIGFIPLEAMDLIVDPKQQRLIGAHPGGPLHRA